MDMSFLGELKLDEEPFSDNCDMMGYRALDMQAMKYYFWKPKYGLIAIVNQFTQTPTLYETTTKIPDDFYKMRSFLTSPAFIRNHTEKHFNRTSELEDFLNEYMERLEEQE